MADINLFQKLVGDSDRDEIAFKVNENNYVSVQMDMIILFY
jgi:hypothetical protein